MINTTCKYKHLFFDLDHTLWDFKTNSELAMKQCLAQSQLLSNLPSFADFFSFYEQVNDRLWEEYRQGTTTKAELTMRRFAEPFQHFGLQQDPEQVNSLYLDLMGQQTQLFSGCVEMLEQLKAKGFMLHIISNGFIEVQNNKLQSANIAHYFQSVTLSEIVGSPKPKPDVFAYALKNSNARKSQSIMIGDDWRNDVLGALNFGIDAILFQEQDASYPEISSVSNCGGYGQLALTQARKQACFQVKNLLDIPTLLCQ